MPFSYITNIFCGFLLQTNPFCDVQMQRDVDDEPVFTAETVLHAVTTMEDFSNEGGGLNQDGLAVVDNFVDAKSEVSTYVILCFLLVDETRFCPKPKF